MGARFIRNPFRTTAAVAEQGLCVEHGASPINEIAAEMLDDKRFKANTTQNSIFSRKGKR